MVKRLLFLAALIPSMVFSQTGVIADGESGSSARTKLNATIVKANTIFSPDQTSYVGTYFLGTGGTKIDNTGTDAGDFNTYVGMGAGDSSIIAKYNTALGRNALHNTQSGWSNTAIGVNTLMNGVGTGSLDVSGSGGEFYANTAVGQGSQREALTASYNTSVGVASLLLNESGHNNVALGVHALNDLISGDANVAIGRSALFELESVDNCTAVGAYALQNNQVGENTALGASALANLTTGVNNCAIGYRSMLNGNSATENTAMGTNSLRNITDGERNVGVGNRSGYSNESGFFNVYIGMQAGELATSNSNVLIGYRSGNSITSGANNITLGYDIDVPSATTHYQLNIGDLITGSMTGEKYVIIDGSMILAPQAADPAAPQDGMIYFNTTDNHFYGYNGAAFVQLDN